jgi:hypothetical protein
MLASNHTVAHLSVAECSLRRIKTLYRQIIALEVAIKQKKTRPI